MINNPAPLADTACPECGGDGCNWDTYPNADGVAELCEACDGTGERDN